MNIEREKYVPINGFEFRQHVSSDLGILAYPGRPDHLAYDCYPGIVPDGEIWYDYRFTDELGYQIWVEKKFAGTSGDSFVSKREEWIKKKLGSRTIRQILSDENFVVKRSRLGTTEVVYVDGGVIRKIDPYFISGGHAEVYPLYIKNPREEWIDFKLDPRDQAFSLSHELMERQLMGEGILTVFQRPGRILFREALDYDPAHAIAKVFEENDRRLAGGSYLGDANWPKEWSDPAKLRKFLKIIPG